MSNTDFEAMTNSELKAYVLEHRDDQDAIHALNLRIKATGKTLNSLDELGEYVERKRQQQDQQ